MRPSSQECFAYDNVLGKSGHFVRLEALQNAQTAKTLRYRNGNVSITDGPYAETKEQIGGILLLDANDLNHATQLMTKHPGIRVATFEIRAPRRGIYREGQCRRESVSERMGRVSVLVPV